MHFSTIVKDDSEGAYVSSMADATLKVASHLYVEVADSSPHEVLLELIGLTQCEI